MLCLKKIFGVVGWSAALLGALLFMVGGAVAMTRKTWTHGIGALLPGHPEGGMPEMVPFTAIGVTLFIVGMLILYLRMPKEDKKNFF